MGINPEASHREQGPGQNEIEFKYIDALNVADNLITFKSVVQTIAGMNGLHASFILKPLPNHNRMDCISIYLYIKMEKI